jgi:hypothetical protein
MSPKKSQDKESGLIKLYWYMLKNNKEYLRDYKALMTNHSPIKETAFCKKWGLLHPFDPEEKEEPPIGSRSVYIDLKQRASQAVHYVSGPADGVLEIAVNLKFSRTKILKEVTAMVDLFQPDVKDLPAVKNLFGEVREESDAHYENLIFAHQLRTKGYSYGEILQKAKAEKRNGFNTRDNVINFLKRYKELEAKMPVPIRGKKRK